MTDNEIFETEIKCINRRANGKCNGGTDCCKCDLLMNEKDIISAYERAIANSNLINRQEAEIKRLKGECVNCPMLKAKSRTIDCLNEQIKDWQKGYCEIKQEIKTIKAEAIKEFAERLKKPNRWRVEDIYYIDTLVKEMVGQH